MFGGRLAKNAFSKELVCMTLTKEENSKYEFHYEIIDQRGDIPEPRYGHSLHKFKNSLLLFGGIKEHD